MGAIWCAPGCGRGHEAPVHRNDTVAAWTPIFWACWHLAASRREARRVQPWGFKTCCKLGNPCTIESRRCWKPRPMPIKTSTGIGCRYTSQCDSLSSPRHPRLPARTLSTRGRGGAETTPPENAWTYVLACVCKGRAPLRVVLGPMSWHTDGSASSFFTVQKNPCVHALVYACSMHQCILQSCTYALMHLSGHGLCPIVLPSTC